MRGISLLLGALLYCAVCNSNAQMSKEFQDALRQSSWILYQELNPANEFKNFIFSPMSISHVFGMLRAGAKGNTKKQLTSMLCNCTDPSFDINEEFRFHKRLFYHGSPAVNYPTVMANKLYLRGGFTPKRTYKTTLQRDYAAQVEEMTTVNPSIWRETVNNWVSEKTNGLIDDVVKPGDITALTELVLVNTIYFKAEWETKFSVIEQKDEMIPWWVAQTRNTVPIESMILRSDFYYIDNEATSGMQYFAVPMETDIDSFFVIAQPKRRYHLALKHFEQYLFETFLRNYLVQLRGINGLSTTEYPANNITWNRSLGETFKMPYFTAESDVNLKDELQTHLSDLFDQHSADLTGIAEYENNNLYVNFLRHSAKIQVNENGTVAAAATAGGSATRTLGFGQQHFECDQPFFYAIYQENQFLFMGNLYTPTHYNPGQGQGQSNK